MVIRMVSTSERRLYMLANVALYVLIMGGFLLMPMFQPKAVDVGDLRRLAVTLAIWVSFVLLSEWIPVKEAEDPE